MYYAVPLAAVTAYMLFLFFGSIIMSKLPAFKLTGPLVLWNLFLSGFSFIGVVRVVPHLLLIIKTQGLEGSICKSPVETFGAGAAGVWSFLFIISKFPELIDTVFIVLRKKPLIFLHWYHHVTVLLYTWQAYATQTGAGIYFIAMNYTVHAIMYFYYAMKALHMWPKFIPSWLITILQLSQMVGGIAVCYLTKVYRDSGVPCAISETSYQTGIIMYFSYFLLFLQILFKLLSAKPAKKKTNSTKKNQ